MTYARKMAGQLVAAVDAEDGTLDGNPVAAAEGIIRLIIERCAKEAEIWCKDEGCEDPAHEWSKRAADRIRALATTRPQSRETDGRGGLMTCYKCGSTQRELRPYGKDGAQVCFACAMGTPEDKAEAERQLSALLGEAGPTAVLTDDGPASLDVVFPKGGAQ